LPTVDDRLQGDSNDSVIAHFVIDSVKRCRLSGPGTKGWSPKRSSSPSSDNSERLSPMCNYSSIYSDFYYPTKYLSNGNESRYTAKVARLCIYLCCNKKGRIMAVT